jgi:NUMOD3 motif
VGFDIQEMCTDFALTFSKNNNIVESEEWANLQDENGLTGAPCGDSHHIHRITNPMLGKNHTQESKSKMGQRHDQHWAYGKKQSQNTIDKKSIALKGRLSPKKGVPVSEETRQKMIIAASKRKGIKREQSVIEKMSISRKGKGRGPQSAEHVKKRTESRLESIKLKNSLSSQIIFSRFEW